MATEKIKEVPMDDSSLERELERAERNGRMYCDLMSFLNLDKSLVYSPTVLYPTVTENWMREGDRVTLTFSLPEKD